MSTDPLAYVLSCLRRAADNAYPWSLTPTEAGALVAEVERLRGERAAVVAFLREEAEVAAQTHTVQAGEWASRIDNMADTIERCEHRREEEK